MPDAQTKKTTISEARDGDTEFFLRTGDNHLFIRTGKQIIDSCNLGISIDLWIEELTSMIQRVREWSTGESKIRGCYCAPGVSRVIFFFSLNAQEFDFDFADRLVDFNLQLIRDFNVGMVETRQIPAAEIDRFVDPDSTRLVYGEHFKSSETVET